MMRVIMTRALVALALSFAAVTARAGDKSITIGVLTDLSSFAALTLRMHQMAVATFLEDQALLEAQQRRLADDPDRALLDTRNDVGAVHARRIVGQRAMVEGDPV